MQTKPKITTTSISYLGDRIHETLAAHADVVHAIGSFCGALLDATIRVHASPRGEGEPLEWSLDISSPAGRTTVLAHQRSNEKVRFSYQ